MLCNFGRRLIAAGRTAAVLLLAVAGAAWAQTCASPGLDGPASASGVINSYHAGSGTAPANSINLSVASIGGQRSNPRVLRAGDLILVMQMQDSVSPTNAGKYEYAQIHAISGTSLTLRSGLVNSYTQAVNTTAVRTFQVVWVPQFSTLNIAGTVTADRWNIANASGLGTGGIVAFDVAGDFSLTGSVDAAGMGFRGGAGINGNYARAGGSFSDLDYNFNQAMPHGGLKGEGIEGTPPLTFQGSTALIDYSPLLGQGYAGGAAGRRARANAGGGGNDGNPSNANPPGGGSNEYNSGGGGGANAGAGGRGGNAWNANSTAPLLNQPGGNSTGNEAGGLGGNSHAGSSLSLAMGGGGGAGGANNGFSGSTITSWPPTASAGANGAAGAVTSSGASGGGIVLIRAGRFSGGGRIDVSGYRAYNKAPVGESDAGGGGGGGGSIYLVANSGTGAGSILDASGGSGGSSNYFNHGPGGGGGGGRVITNLSGATINVAGGSNGVDGCCGGTSNGSPKPYNSTPGAPGLVEPAVSPAAGAQGGASCLPVLSLVKTTTTPQRVVPTNTTAQYTLAVANAPSGSGAAYGVSLRDVLPPPFGLPSINATATYALSGTGTLFVGPGSTVPNSSGVTSTVQFGVPGEMTHTFTIFPGGRVTVTFTVLLNNTGTGGIFQNSAALSFIDPTRPTGSAATTPTTSLQPVVSPGQSYSTGGAVQGNNYASSSSTGEDVQLLATAKLTISKTNGVSTLISGQTTSYTITVANLGPASADGTVLRDPAASGLVCTGLSCTVAMGNAACPSSSAVGDLQSPAGLAIPSFPAASTLTFQLICEVTATGS